MDCLVNGWILFPPVKSNYLFSNPELKSIGGIHDSNAVSIMASTADFRFVLLIYNIILWLHGNCKLVRLTHNFTHILITYMSAINPQSHVKFLGI